MEKCAAYSWSRSRHFAIPTLSGLYGTKNVITEKLARCADILLVCGYITGSTVVVRRYLFLHFCPTKKTDELKIVAGDSRCFRFDHVFGVESTQQEVYDKTTHPLVERCLDGFNATILAYGQTGSGKTWTVGNAYTVSVSLIPMTHHVVLQGVNCMVEVEEFPRVPYSATSGFRRFNVCQTF